MATRRPAEVATSTVAPATTTGLFVTGSLTAKSHTRSPVSTSKRYT